MPILPIIDLLILLGWTSLLAGGLIKAIHVTTNYNPMILGLGPMDLLLIAGMLLLLALTLAARTWVKLYEPQLLSRRSVANRELLERQEAFRGNGGVARPAYEPAHELRESAHD